ncbi:DUF6624 domain-containing protein [Streptomyces triculaminicus]|uniref:DUF6624 domain-containing protein n=1 Tax=Streptomyces triculaminicus TaxID=2816232 RepID=UPI0033F82223
MDVRHERASVYLFARFGSLWRLGVIEHPRYGGWMISGGHVEPGESPEETVVREVLEETGHRVRLLQAAGQVLPADYPHPQAAGRTARGRSWWVVAVPAGPDGRHPARHAHANHLHVGVVDRPYGPREPGEHPFRWATADELETLDAPADHRILGTALLEQIPAMITADRSRPPMDDELRRELLRRRDIDQEVRTNLPETVTEETAERWAAMDNDNTQWLWQVIDRVGWPGRSLVGDEAADAAWLLAQHADRQPHLQEAWADLLAEAVTQGEAPPRHLAFLEDRISVRATRDQWFGTQHRKSPTGQWEPFPVREPDGVDQRRAENGLEPLSENTKRINETY